MTGKAWIGIVLAVICVSSVGIRHVMGGEKEESVATSPTPARGVSGSNSLVARGDTSVPVSKSSDAAAKKTSDSFIAKSLPFVTEASFFGLIGFALGYFSRKVVKLMLILLAILFIALQVLSYIDVVTIDWQKLIDVVNGLILNLKENYSISAVLKDRVPTAGALVAGYFLGFRKG